MALPPLTALAFCLVISTGSLAQHVSVEQSVTGFVGTQVALSCQFVDPNKTVVVTHVAWVKDPSGAKTKLAVYNPILGAMYPAETSDRILFREPSVDDATLIINPLQMGDDGVYSCEFATFPEGNQDGTTNLTVLGGSQGFTIEPAESNLYVRIGGEAEFTVRPSSAISSGDWDFKSKTIVTWIGTTSSILPEYRSRVNLNFTSGSLVLRSVNESDNGDYTVRVTAVGGAAQASATITLKELRSLAQHVSVEQSVTGFVGAQVALSCQFVDLDKTVVVTQVAWVKDPSGAKTNLAVYNPIFGAMYPAETSDRILFREPSLDDATLIINPLQMGDDGVYSCEFATFPEGNQDGTTNLTVLGGSQGFTIEPAESNLYVRIGGEAEFTVRPSSAISSGDWDFKSKTIVTWIGTTSSILPEYRSRVNLNFTSGSLVLRSVNESDNGDYTVRVTAVGGAAQASATITLKELRSLAQHVSVEQSVTGFVGAQVALSCQFVDLDKTVVVTQVAWVKDPSGAKTNLAVYNPIFGAMYPAETRDRILFREPSLDDATLIINPLQMGDDGVYSCEFATFPEGNQDGTTNLTVLGGSQGFTIEPAESNLYVRIGGEAEFTVRPSSAISSGDWDFKSKTIVTWIGTTSSILPEYRSRVNLNFTSGSLVLRSVNESDNGDYTVRVTAVGGAAQASATITLKELPLSLAAVPETRSGLTPGAVAGIVVGLIAACLFGGVCGWLIARKTSWPKSGTKHDANRSPGRQTASATDAGYGLDTYENLPGNEQGISHEAAGDSTYMALKLDDRSVYSELQR